MDFSLRIEEIYRFITNPMIPMDLIVNEEGFVQPPQNEQWRSSRSRILKINAESPHVLLPPPFLLGRFQIERIANEYKAGIILESAVESFHQSHEWNRIIYPGIKQTYQNQFVPVSQRGGYIINKVDRTPLMTLDAYEGGVSINIGTDGCSLRQLKDKEEFAADMSALEKVANKMLSLGLGENNPDVKIFMSVH